MLQPHATMCCFSSGRLIEGNNKTRSCLNLPGKHENIACSINSDCFELSSRDVMWGPPCRPDIPT